MNILQKAAEILVERGYAHHMHIDQRAHLRHNPPIDLILIDSDVDNIRFSCDPFADTLEGRRQSDAIEDYLFIHKFDLFNESVIIKPMIEALHLHQWRLDGIKWCLEQLSENNHEAP